MAEPTYRSSVTASRPLGPDRRAGTPQAAGTVPLACHAVSTPAEQDVHFRIRHQVFVIEQGLFRGTGGAADGDDRDSYDDDPATIHVIGFADGVICGTVRLYPLRDAPGRWKGDRLAVLASHRHLGLGAPLVRFAVSAAGMNGGQEMEAYIQPANVTFFRWLGWRPNGPLVNYAGMPHQRMLISLRTGPGSSPIPG